MLEKFVSLLDRGITVDGNFVPLEIEGVEWVDTEDALLKAQVAVRVTVTFNGGVYKDTDFGPLTHVEVVEIEKGEYRWRVEASRKLRPQRRSPRSCCRLIRSGRSTRLRGPSSLAYVPQMTGSPAGL